jgi:mono/diheme cytochrome c family protein
MYTPMVRIMRAVLLVVLFVVVLTWASGVVPAATLPGDIGAGARLALDWCSGCHVVAARQTRPVVDGVPSFFAIAKDPRTTEFRLRAYLQTPHPVMPNFQLSRQQTDDLVSYILHFKGQKN